ncbi:uncharacterized protein LOC660232 [Tribolium castaneum]|uniref:Circadian clock-controlled protein-like Protein n=1 Tax=Tribolium castaneum TaxID=7070 RepID=D6WNT5_TRICA|nr:PREDICTED: uncharacterized protein LOC660232 [Tribolium castaneum]EFA03851.1 hypothetical protein TcasGA2_TC013967 [Tribolium castaneum]|eukprot:XP_008192971.1 PREDICTED: uncharacterized protein LOC660232 [Tribolium castaneum]
MRRLLIAACLIATICAYHIQKQDFDVVIDKVEYSSKVPLKYNFRRGALKPTEEVLLELSKTLDKTKSGTEAIINDYADKIFANLHDLMIHGFDPIEMPDQHSGFNYTLIITYHGELDLTHGWLSDISTIHRGGDVVVTYSSNTKYLEVTVPIAFDDMQFTYDYSAKIMGLGPTGGIEGKIAKLTCEVKIGFDVEAIQASLDEFYITNSGHITFHFNGNVLVDWLLNLLTDVTTILLKEVILLVVEGVVRGGLTSAVDAINDAINGFLNPTTPIPDTTPALMYFN